MYKPQPDFDNSETEDDEIQKEKGSPKADNVPSKEVPADKQKLLDGGYGTQKKDGPDKATPSALPPKPGLSQEVCDKLVSILRSNSNQSEIEDALAEQPEGIKFNAKLRKQLEICITERKELPKELKKALLAEIEKDNIRPKLLDDLNKFLNQTATRDETDSLLQELGQGLFKKDLVEGIITEDTKAKRFGDASTAIWKEVVKKVENESSAIVGQLVAAQAKYVETGAPFTAKQYQSWVDQSALGSFAAQPKVSLGIDTKHTPDVLAMSKLQDTNFWNDVELSQVTALQREVKYNELAELAVKHKRSNWIPEKDLNPIERERRFLEMSGILGPAKVAEDTLKVLKWITSHREIVDEMPWLDQPIWDSEGLQKQIFAHHQWMLDAIKTFPGDAETGLATIPKDLADTISNRDDIKKPVDDWMEKYGPQAGQCLSRLMVNLHTEGLVLYGLRDKVNEGDKNVSKPDPAKTPVEGNDYNQFGYDFEVTKTIGADGQPIYKVTQYTDYIYSGWGNLYDLHIGTGRVDKQRESSTHIYTDNDLVPFSDGRQILFVEPSRLESLHSRERGNFNRGKGIEVGLDAFFVIMPGARGGKLALGAIEKQGFKGLMSWAVAKELASHGAMASLALAGGFNNAAVRQSSKGPTALWFRHGAFLTLIGRDLYRKMTTDGLEALRAGQAAASKEAGAINARVLENAAQAGELAEVSTEATESMDAIMCAVADGNAAQSERYMMNLMRSQTRRSAAAQSLKELTNASTGARELATAGESGVAPGAGGLAIPGEARGAGELAAAGESGVAPVAQTSATSTQGSSRVQPSVSLVSKSAKVGNKLFTKLEKPLESIDAVVQVGMCSSLGRELFGLTIGKTLLQNEVIRENSNQTIKESRKLFERLSNDLLSNSARNAITSNTSPELLEQVKKIFGEEKDSDTTLSDPVAKQARYNQLADAMGANTSYERVAAIFTLLRLKEKLTLNDSTENFLIRSLKEEFKRSQSTTESKDMLSPAVSLVMAQTLLAHESITQQQYTLEVARIANLKSAGPETKMQAISNLGLCAWSAEVTEKKHETDANYWSTNHGCSKEDLLKQLQQISSGANGEAHPDVRAFATTTLYALRHAESDARLAKLNDSVLRWKENFKTEATGTYAKFFAGQMQKLSAIKIANNYEAQIVEDSKLRSREQLRADQYLASVALTELGNEQVKEGLIGLSRTIDFSAPGTTVLALNYLAPRLQELDEKERNSVIEKTILLLQIPYKNLDAATTAALDRTKANMLQNIIPSILSHANSAGPSNAFDRGIAAISKLIDRSPNNMWFSQNADLRALAVEALAAVHATKGEPQLRALLKYNEDKSATGVMVRKPSPIVAFPLGQGLDLNNILNMNLPNVDLPTPLIVSAPKYVPAEPSPYARLAAMRTLRSVRASGLREIAEEIVKHDDDPRMRQEAQDILDQEERPADKSVADAKPSTPTVDQKKAAEVNKFVKANLPEILKADVEKFLKGDPDLSNLLKDQFDKDMNRLSPEYSRYIFVNEYDHLSRYPDQIFADARQESVEGYFKDIDRLGRWALGKFNTAENITENGIKKTMADNPEVAQLTQEKAIKCMAVFASISDPSKAVLPALGLKKANIASAKHLAQVALKATDPEMRSLAARHVINLMGNKDMYPEAKLALVSAFRGLSSSKNTALLSKAEAAKVTIDTLVNYRQGPMCIEEIPEHLRTAAQQKEYDSTMTPGAYSIHLQDLLMHDITYRYQDRENGLPVLEKIARETKHPGLRAKAQEYILTLKGGVGLAYRNAVANPDKTTPLTRRTALISEALKTANTDLDKSINIIFKNSSGKPLNDPKDPRLAVLTEGLKHDNHYVQLASALSLVNNKSGGDYYRLAIRKLAQFSANDSDAYIRHEAQQKLEEIRKETDKKQRDLAWYSTRPQGKTAEEKERYKTTAAHNAQIHATNLNDLAAVRESAAKSSEGILFFHDLAVFNANTDQSGLLSPERAVIELNKRVKKEDGSLVGENEMVEQLLLIGLRTNFSANGQDDASEIYKEFLEEKNERISMAAATVIFSRSPNIAVVQTSIEKLAKLEANAHSETLKKEAAAIFDRSLKSLKEQNPSNLTIKNLITRIETERARALGLPVNLTDR